MSETGVALNLQAVIDQKRQRLALIEAEAEAIREELRLVRDHLGDLPRRRKRKAAAKAKPKRPTLTAAAEPNTTGSAIF